VAGTTETAHNIEKVENPAISEYINTSSSTSDAITGTNESLTAPKPVSVLIPPQVETL